VETLSLKYFPLLLLIFLYSCSDKNSHSQDQTNTFYDKAFEYRDQNKIDSAFLNFYKAKDVFLQQRDTLGAAKCFVNMAIIQEKQGDNFGSQESGISAIRLLNKKSDKDRIFLAINYNTLGIVSGKQKNYNQATEFYKQALLFNVNPNDKIIYENNLANNYRRNSQYGKALETYNSIAKGNQKNNVELARTITNLVYTKWLQNPAYNPASEFYKALKIRLKEKDSWGLNSSYSHLADYYTGKQKDSALLYAKKMYVVAKEIESPDDQIEALQKLIALDNPDSSKKYFKVYQKLNDSLQTARNKAKNQFALIRYETEKNKADFLEAKTESTQRQNYIIVQYFVIGIVILAFILGYFEFKKRKKILQQEKLLEVKNTELKYSKKVHDRVANRIYQILSSVENKAIIDRESLLFNLENVYETSRDISYDNEDINENQNYFEQLHNMLDSYSSDSVTIIYFGNNEELWNGVNFQIKTEIYLILQELMTNMKKHSQADKVFLKFTNEKSIITISYTDNGIGIKNHIPKNGLQNMENRINSINGKINFDTETNNLLKINITFPI